MYILKFVTGIACFLLSIGTASAGSDDFPKRLTGGWIKPGASWAADISPSGELWTAYYGKPKRLIVRRPSGELIDLPDAADENAPSGLAFVAGDTSATVMWRNKTPNKGLYYLSSLPAEGEPSATTVIDRGSEPLGRFLLEQQGSDVFTLWLGERKNQETKENYHLYFSHSADGGKKWRDAERVLPGIYPAWIVTEKSIPVFSWYRKEGERVFGVRIFDRKTGTFGETTIIKKAPLIPHLFRAFSSGNRWFLLWKGRYGEDGEEARLEGVSSDDEGKSWKEFEFKTIRGLDVSSLDLNVEQEGALYIAFSGRMPPEPGMETKDTIYFTRSVDGGDSWSPPKPVRSESLTKAKHPKILPGKVPGEVILAWIDWRNIRPMAYLTRSTDHGATWGPQVALDQEGKGRDILGFHLDEKSVWHHDDGYLVIAERFNDDARSVKELLAYSMPSTALVDAADETPHENLTEDRLRQRIGEYWDAVIEGNYGKAYDYQDPTFRTLFSRESYWGAMGRIKYHSFEVKEIEITGTVAKVKEVIEASIPEFELGGKSVSRPKTPYNLETHWLFVGGDWHREYFEESTETRFIKY